MDKLTFRKADKYIRDNYGEPRHDVKVLVKAIKRVAKASETDAVDLFHLLIENQPMYGTHSYGFHTAYGRDLIDTMQSEYYKIK